MYIYINNFKEFKQIIFFKKIFIHTWVLLLTFQMIPIFWTDNIAKSMGKNAALAQNKILVHLVIPSIFFTRAGRYQEDGTVPCIIFFGVASLCILDLWKILDVTLNFCCWAAEGTGKFRHVDSCNSGSEQELPHSLDYLSSWARSVSACISHTSHRACIEILFWPYLSAQLYLLLYARSKFVTCLSFMQYLISFTGL